MTKDKIMDESIMEIGNEINYCVDPVQYAVRIYNSTNRRIDLMEKQSCPGRDQTSTCTYIQWNLTIPNL